MAIYDLSVAIPPTSTLKTGDILNCPYCGTYKSITLPKGTYKLECWGAEGGNFANNGSKLGGAGGYSYGTLNLTSDTLTHLFSGQYAATGNVASIFGGGGTSVGGASDYSSPGGGGSDIRLGDSPTVYARVLVAGGGGAAGNGGTSYAATGGAGGGELGLQGTSAGFDAGVLGGVGALTNGGSIGYWKGYNTYGQLAGTFGQGGNGGIKDSSFGGGGGWYGGGGCCYVSGGGGSGYAYTPATSSYYPSGCLLNPSQYLTETSLVPGTNNVIQPDGTTSIGRRGHGYTRITIISINAGGPMIKIGGQWKQSDTTYVKVNGVWKPSEGLYIKKDGAWKLT